MVGSLSIYLFVGHGKLLARVALVLAADKIRNLLVLGLLDGALIVLRPLAEHVLLHPVDTCLVG